MEITRVPPGEPLPDLDEHYPWPEAGSWLRCMMLVTLDGAFRGHDGVSGSLSSPADQHVFATTRRFAHVILVGAETVRREEYTPLTVTAADAAARLEAGLTASPVLAIVSGSLELPWDDPLFSESPVRPIVITTEGANPERLAAARACSDLVTLPGDRVDVHQLVSALAYRGLVRITCEGGPTLLAQLSRAGLVDEADITISPMQVGGGQIDTGVPTDRPTRLRLDGLIEQDGWLFTRYVRALSA